MSTTPIYGIEEWEQNQEQPHITSNTAWRILEAMSARRLASKSYTAPPDSPAGMEGDVFFIDGVGSDAWDGHANEFAIAVGGGWHFVTPRTGWIFWVIDEAGHFWIDVDGSPLAWNAL